jgi:ATP-dependent Clp protease ATP-binding subunit ClpA
MASLGRIDEVIGRDDEIERLLDVDVLVSRPDGCRKDRNGPRPE